MPETIKITVSGKTLSVKIEDNEATKALVASLREASITYEAHDYARKRYADYHAGRGCYPVQRQPDCAVLR